MNLNFMNFSFFLLAASSWAVKKTPYAARRSEGMIKNFKEKLTEDYKKNSENNLSCKERESLNKGYKLYIEGLKYMEEYSNKKDPFLLIKGLSSIEKGRVEFSAKSFSSSFNTYILKTLKETLEEQN